MQQKIQKSFLVSRDICVQIGCVKLSQLKREYLPSALSVLGNSLEIYHITNRDFLQVNCLRSNHRYGKGAAIQFSRMFGRVYHVAFLNVPWKATF